MMYPNSCAREYPAQSIWRVRFSYIRYSFGTCMDMFSDVAIGIQLIGRESNRDLGIAILLLGALDLIVNELVMIRTVQPKQWTYVTIVVLSLIAEVPILVITILTLDTINPAMAIVSIALTIIALLSHVYRMLSARSRGPVKGYHSKDDVTVQSAPVVAVEK